MLLVNLRAISFLFAVSEVFGRVLEASDSHRQLSDIKKVCGGHVTHALPALIKFHF